MEWQMILVLLLVIPIILFPAVFVWYLNVGGLYAAVKAVKEGRFGVSEAVVRRIRTGLAVAVPVGIYAFAVWFSFGHFGWPVALAVALALPVVLFVPVLVWAVVVSGLYQVVRETMRQRATAPRRTPAQMVEEPVRREVA